MRYVCPNCVVCKLWLHDGAISDNGMVNCPNCRWAGRITGLRFPIMDGPSVPWAMIEPHERQARENHDQSLSRLAGCGGLSSCEAMAVLNDEKWYGSKWQKMAPAESSVALAAFTKAWEARPEIDRLRGELATVLSERDAAVSVGTQLERQIARLVGRSTPEGRVGEERILCAAIYVDTGKVEPPRASYAYPATGIMFCAWRHGDCFVSMTAWSDLLTPEEAGRIGEEQLRGLHQGFLTSRGRYVTREEAATIARAAGQITTEATCLFSEDLY